MLLAYRHGMPCPYEPPSFVVLALSEVEVCPSFASLKDRLAHLKG
jgi:hypothetical protein